MMEYVYAISYFFVGLVIAGLWSYSCGRFIGVKVDGLGELILPIMLWPIMLVWIGIMALEQLYIDISIRGKKRKDD